MLRINQSGRADSPLSVIEFKELIELVNYVVSLPNAGEISERLYKCLWYSQIVQDIVYSSLNDKRASEYTRLATTLKNLGYRTGIELILLFDLRTDIVHEFNVPAVITRFNNKNDEYFNKAFQDVVKILDFFKRAMGLSGVEGIHPITTTFKHSVRGIIATEKEVASGDGVKEESNHDLLLLIEHAKTTIPTSIFKDAKGSTDREKIINCIKAIQV